MAAGLTGRRDGSQDRVGIDARILGSKQARPAAGPGGVVIGNLGPRRSKVGAGIVVFPDVGDRQEIHGDACHVRYDRRASVWGGIGPARGRLKEINDRLAAAWTASLSDVGAL